MRIFHYVYSRMIHVNRNKQMGRTKSLMTIMDRHMEVEDKGFPVGIIEGPWVRKIRRIR